MSRKKINPHYFEEIDKKKRNVKNEQGATSKRFTYIFLKFFLGILIYNSISLTEEKPLERRNLKNSLKITMLFNGGGKRQIIGETFFKNFNYRGDQLYINNNTKAIGLHTSSYELEEGLINVTIIFGDRNITSCKSMFENLQYLIEIDLSEFDSSQVVNMESMFSNCNNLKKIDISNFNTENVQNMGSMFKNCQSLTSLDQIFPPKKIHLRITCSQDVLF